MILTERERELVICAFPRFDERYVTRSRTTYWPRWVMRYDGPSGLYHWHEYMNRWELKDTSDNDDDVCHLNSLVDRHVMQSYTYMDATIYTLTRDAVDYDWLRALVFAREIT